MFCSNINAVLQIVYKLQGKKNNALALYAFLQHLKLHIFNYTIITYGCVNVNIRRKWDKDRSTQNESEIPVIYNFF